MLIQIIAGTFLAGVVSVWLAWMLCRSFLTRHPQHMLSLAAGALLATAFINLLPEAFDSDYSAKSLFLIFFLGLLTVIVLDNAEVLYRAHVLGLPSGHQRTPHEHISSAPTGRWAVLFGGGVHAFADGILIASAFLANEKLGWGAAFAVLLHEVPHHLSDLAVVGNGGSKPRKAVLKVTLAGSFTMAGGLAGYLIVGQLAGWLPMLLVLAASSFAYVALSDIIPQLNRPKGLRQTIVQLSCLLFGSLLVSAAVMVAGGHGH